MTIGDKVVLFWRYKPDCSWFAKEILLFFFYPPSLSQLHCNSTEDDRLKMCVLFMYFTFKEALKWQLEEHFQTFLSLSCTLLISVNSLITFFSAIFPFFSSSNLSFQTDFILSLPCFNLLLFALLCLIAVVFRCFIASLFW